MPDVAPTADQPGLALARDRQSAFLSVVALNEVSKELMVRSFQVNLLALDAMVQSARSGGNLRGFDEVASQMRDWSRELHRELLRLGELSRSAIERTSLWTKQARALRLLAEAVSSSRHAMAEAAYARSCEAHVELGRVLARDRRAVNDLLRNIDQLGMMAIVLSRSAMIEATSGNAEQRPQFSQIARDFYRHSQAVLNTLRGISKLT